jgi:hypothetical protein
MVQKLKLAKVKVGATAAAELRAPPPLPTFRMRNLSRLR